MKKRRASTRAPKAAPSKAKTRPTKDGYVTSAEFAVRVGVSKNAASYMQREEGAPCDAHGWRWPEALHWFIRREKARGRPVDGGGNDAITEIRRRRELAQAEIAELDLAARRSETMTVTQFADAVGSAFARVRARALNLPGKIAGEGEMKPREELLVIVEGLVHEMLEELSAGEDVPMSVDAGAEAA